MSCFIAVHRLRQRCAEFEERRMMGVKWQRAEQSRARQGRPDRAGQEAKTRRELKATAKLLMLGTLDLPDSPKVPKVSGIPCAAANAKPLRLISTKRRAV